jgi:hypothetical protein
VDGGIISGYEVLEEASSGRAHLPKSLRAHTERFGRRPELLAADRGLYSSENERLAQQLGVKRVVLPKSGRLSKKRESDTRSNAGSQARLQVSGRDRRSHQCPHARLRAGSVPRSRRRRDEQMGWLGHLGAQLKADLPNPGNTAGWMRTRKLKSGARRVSQEFPSYRYGHFAPQTRTRRRAGFLGTSLTLLVCEAKPPTGAPAGTPAASSETRGLLTLTLARSASPSGVA